MYSKAPSTYIPAIMNTPWLGALAISHSPRDHITAPASAKLHVCKTNRRHFDGHPHQRAICINEKHYNTRPTQALYYFYNMLF